MKISNYSIAKKNSLILALAMVSCAKTNSDSTTGQSAPNGEVVSISPTSTPAEAPTPPSGESSLQLLQNILNCDASVEANIEAVNTNCSAIQQARKDGVFVEALQEMTKDGETFLNMCMANVDCSILTPSPTSPANTSDTVNEHMAPAPDLAKNAAKGIAKVGVGAAKNAANGAISSGAGIAKNTTSGVLNAGTGLAKNAASGVVNSGVGVVSKGISSVANTGNVVANKNAGAAVVANTGIGILKTGANIFSNAANGIFERLASKDVRVTPDFVEKTASTAGFIYDPNEDIYVTKIDSWQRYPGYTSFFDQASLPLGMVIDTEPIVYKSGGKTYMIELWKGQYYASTGAEIGIYEQNGNAWKSPVDEDLLQMEYVLKRRHKILSYSSYDTVFRRAGKTWWLTGFKPGVFSNPTDLVMEDIKITFKTDSDKNGFLDALKALGYTAEADKITTHGTTVGFVFDRPKSSSPWTQNIALTTTWQTVNRVSSMSFKAAKFIVGRKDNSPATIALISNRFIGTLKFIPAALAK